MVTSTAVGQLDEVLGSSLEYLGLSDEDYALMKRRYEVLGSFLTQYWRDVASDGELYGQGSMELGVPIRNYHRNDDYDLDAVSRRDIDKDAITKAELKADLGRGLAQFARINPEHPEREDRNRCWTLHYPGAHMDILPTVPDAEALPNGVLVTDRDFHQWQFANPRGYAEWFHGRMADELNAKQAFARKMEVAPIPANRAKTTLQLSVMALKRHRDIFFTDDLAARPASCIITHTAALAYKGQGNLLDVLREITTNMSGFIRFDNGKYQLPNPVQPKENFADWWNIDRKQADNFGRWIEAAEADFHDLSHLRGDGLFTKLAKSFGQRSADYAGVALGSGVYNATQRRDLGVTSAASLIIGTSRPNLPKNFHGDGPAPRRA